jgi:hypothetical protein
VNEVTCLGQEIHENPRTEESRLFDPSVVRPVQESGQ